MTDTTERKHKKGGRTPEDILLNAIGPYLESIGWRALVAGVDRVQQEAGSLKYNYELVIKFTGSKIPDPPNPAKKGSYHER